MEPQTGIRLAALGEHEHDCPVSAAEDPGECFLVGLARLRAVAGMAMDPKSPYAKIRIRRIGSYVSGQFPEPSGTDEETFQRVFALPMGRDVFSPATALAMPAAIQRRPRGEIAIPVEVDYSLPFGPSAFEDWDAENMAKVHDANLSGLDRSRLTNFGPARHRDEWPDDLFAMDLPSAGLFGTPRLAGSVRAGRKRGEL